MTVGIAPPELPTSTILSGWMRQLAPWRPRTVWLGNLFGHQCQATFPVGALRPLDRLDAILLLALESISSDGVSHGDLGNALDLPAATITALLRRLDSLGLAVHHHGGWLPTDAGRTARQCGQYLHPAPQPRRRSLRDRPEQIVGREHHGLRPMRPDQPLDQPLPGPVDPFSYGAGLLFKFVEERFGADAVREIWEGCINGANGVADPDWFDVLDDVITNHGSTFADAFTEFVTWNLHTGPFADETSYADAAQYPRLRIDSVNLPHTDDSLRVFYASSQSFGGAPDGRAEVTAALVATATAPDALEGVRLLLVAEEDGVRTVKEVANLSQGTETIDTSAATKVDVVVINTNREGESKKPGLCIGTTEEVATCIASLGNGEGGAGGGGEGGASDGGGAEGGGTAGDDGEGDGCGCRIDALGEPSPGALVVSALFAAAIGTRRRRKPLR